MKLEKIMENLFLEDNKFYSILESENGKIVMVPNFYKTAIEQSSYAKDSFDWMKKEITLFAKKATESYTVGDVIPLVDKEIIGYRIINGSQLKNVNSNDLISQFNDLKNQKIDWGFDNLTITKLIFDLDILLKKIQSLNEEDLQKHLTLEFSPFEIYKHVTDFYNVAGLIELELDKMKGINLNFIDRICFKHELNKRIRKIEHLILDSEKYKDLFNPLELCFRVF